MLALHPLLSRHLPHPRRALAPALGGLCLGALLLAAGTPARAQAYTLKILSLTGPPFRPSGIGFGVNNAGQATGYSVVPSPDPRDPDIPNHAFLSDPNGGALHDLGTLGGKDANAEAVNGKGQVVGSSSLFPDSYGPFHAFLYSGGVMIDLNSLIAPDLGFTLDSANGISDTGYITGVGVDAEGNYEAFLLTPAAVPEASTTVSLGLLLALGLGGLVITSRRRKMHSA